jgi:hypothetical protein
LNLSLLSKTIVEDLAVLDKFFLNQSDKTKFSFDDQYRFKNEMLLVENLPKTMIFFWAKRHQIKTIYWVQMKKIIYLMFQG